MAANGGKQQQLDPLQYRDTHTDRDQDGVSINDPETSAEHSPNKTKTLPGCSKQDSKGKKVVSFDANPFYQIRERSLSNERRHDDLIDKSNHIEEEIFTLDIGAEAYTHNLIKKAKVSHSESSEALLVDDNDSDTNELTNSHVILQTNPGNQNMDTDGEEDTDNYQVLRAALPAWRSATSHRGLQKKAALRYYYLKKELEQDHLPSWTLGLEKIPAYLTPLTSDMIALIKKQAKELGEQAKVELINARNLNRELADDHLQVTKLTYNKKQVEDQFDKAERQLNKVTTGYEANEAKKIEAFKAREDKRRPENDQKLADLLCNRTARVPDTQNANQEEAGPSRAPTSNKRRRANSSGRNTPRDTSPADRGRQANRQPRNNQRGNNTPRGYPPRGANQRNPQGNRGPRQYRGPPTGPPRPYQGEDRGRPARQGGPPTQQRGRGRGRGGRPHNDDLLRLLCRRMLDNHI
jgi:hypothetical protein